MTVGQATPLSYSANESRNAREAEKKVFRQTTETAETPSCAQSGSV